MAIYARLDRNTVEALASQFGIEGVTAFSNMEGGLENTSYRVETKSEKYVLTLCDQKTFAQASNLVNLLAHLTEHDVCTSRVVVPPGDSNVVLYDEKPVMLKHYIEGNFTANLSGNILFQLGEEIAQLHKIPAPSYLPQSFPYGRNYFSDVTDSNLDHTYIEWLSEKNSYLEKHIPANLPLALIHGDVFFDNVIVREDQLIAIIDFEEACHYYRCFDLGMLIVGACSDREGVSFDKAARFISGYQKETTLQPIEQETLKIFAVYAAVATSFWRFRQYHLIRPYPQMYEKHVEMQRLADIISACPNSRFMELFAQ